MARRFHDDDYDDRPQTEESTSAKAILLVVLGVLAIIGLGGTAAVGLYFMRFEAVAQERAALQAQAQAQAAAAQFAAVQADADVAAAEAADPFPNPNPPASEEYPTDLAKDREPERQGDWMILFRSDDPAYWDTPGDAAHYAIPLFRTPAGIRFLRLKRTDTGAAIIIPITASQLRAQPKLNSSPPLGGPPGAGLAVAAQTSLWMGTNAVESGARHLGIVLVSSGEPVAGPGVVVEADDIGASGSSGFGHKRGTEGAGQRYVWKGQEIAKAVFEIAVTAADLTEDEKKLLVATEPNP